ncbi:MAG: hypothetical protein BROFUL_02689, partial [Candidatus Brocadia fulgida]
MLEMLNNIVYYGGIDILWKINQNPVKKSIAPSFC